MYRLRVDPEHIIDRIVMRFLDHTSAERKGFLRSGCTCIESVKIAFHKRKTYVCMYTLMSGGPIGYWFDVCMYVCMYIYGT